ncbi:MAG: type II secretion system F family protein [Anaerolineales bacterium]
MTTFPRADRPGDGNHRSMQARFGSVLYLVPVPEIFQRVVSQQSSPDEVRQSGLAWTQYQFLAFRWLLLCISGFFGLLIASGRDWDLFGLAVFFTVIVSGYIYPGFWLRRRIEARRLEIDLALPDFLDRLALGLEAGLGFEIALRRTSGNFPGLLGEELRYVVRQLNLGQIRGVALEGLHKHIPSRDLAAFVAAVKQTDRLGTSLAHTLQVQKKLMRSRRKRRAEEASRRLPILIVFPLVFFFLPALLIIYLAPPLLHLFLGR